MTGTQMIDRVRDIMKDSTSNVQIGEFFHDIEILDALNAGMNAFVNFCFLSRHEHLLSGLIRTINTSATSVAVPADYLHYKSAFTVVGDFGRKVSRIYIGGEYTPYEYTDHDHVAIVGPTMYIGYYSGYNGSITLSFDIEYYSRPTRIDSVTDHRDFHEYVYLDLFTSYAVMILGAKESITQRDYKKLRRYLMDLRIEPEILAQFFPIREKSTIRRLNQYG